MKKNSEIIEKLKSAKSVIVATHIMPDPDAIGSSGALTLALNALGIKASLYLGDGLTYQMKPLVNFPIITDLSSVKAVDLAVITDTATKNRIGGDGAKLLSLSKTSINIDHHLSNEGWADLNLINPSASASAEIVETLISELGVTLTKEMANLLYAGLIDDTGSFRFSNTSKAALSSAGRLVAGGAQPEIVANQLYYSIPECAVKLRAEALTRIRLDLGGKVSLVTVDYELLKKCGASEEDTGNLVEEARAIAGVICALFIRELKQSGSKEWKISLRAKDDSIDVNQVASAFGGGGHKAAAGCKITGTKDEVEKKILSEIAKYLN
jgi:bifunctional oligoribonuclease and PAP phosphatase NrnA